MAALVQPTPSFETETPRARIAVLPDNAGSADRFVAMLVADGLPVTALTTDTEHVDELFPEPPDVVVLVIDCASRSGLTALRRVRSQLPGTRIVVVARSGAPAAAARQSLNAGARAFVHERDAGSSLAAAVHAVLAGLVCVPRELQRLVATPTFSHREKEILELLVTGLGNGQIALRLHLAESTVKSHLASAFAKLGVHSRRDAVALLLDPSEGLAATAMPVWPGSYHWGR